MKKIIVPKAKEIKSSEKIMILLEELKRKDKIIEDLRKENLLLLKVSLKKAQQNLENKKIMHDD